MTKKLLFFFSALMLLIGVASCSESANETKLKLEIKAANKQCPISMGMVGELTKIKFDDSDKEVQFHYSINGEMVDLTNADSEQMKDFLKLSVSSPSMKKLAQKIADSGAGLAAIFRDSESGKKITVRLTVDELREALNNKMSEKEKNLAKLKGMISSENATCPQLIDEGMTMTRVNDDGQNVIYYYDLDEDIYDMDLFKQNISEVKGGMTEVFDDPTMKQIVVLLHSTGRGLIYRYKGDQSGKRADVKFTNSELGRMSK